jgi:hypothetical protein
MGEPVKPLVSSGLRGASKEAWQGQARLRDVLLTKVDHPSAADRSHSTKKEATSSDKSGRSKK